MTLHPSQTCKTSSYRTQRYGIQLPILLETINQASPATHSLTWRHISLQTCRHKDAPAYKQRLVIIMSLSVHDSLVSKTEGINNH